MKKVNLLPIILSVILSILIVIATVFLVVIPYVHANDCYGRGGFVVGYLSCASEPVNNDTLPLASEFDGDVSVFNRCTTNQICLGSFENETKVLLECDVVMHGCPPTSFDDYKVESKSETSDGVYYPRYHVSIFKNLKTMEPYVTPDFITIGTNSQVTWSNYDNQTISLNSVDPDNTWSTSIMPPDGYDTVTFDETGIYEYKGNAGIHGIIVVMDDGGELLSSKFSEVFGNGSPLVYNDELQPVLLYDNCKRYVYWLNEHGKEKINLPEDYPRYPPWGNQIFPLVEFCIDNGELVKTASGDHFRWEFQLEHEK